MSLSKTDQQFFVMSLVALLNAEKGLVYSLNKMSMGVGKTAKIAKSVLDRYEEESGDIYNALDGFDETIRIAAHTAAKRGMLVRGLEGALESLSVVSDSASKLKMEIAMPAFMTTTMFSSMIWMGHSMLPAMAESVDRDRWPIATEMLYDLSHFMGSFWYVIAFAMLSVYFFYRWTLPNWEYSPYRKFVETVIPGYYLYRLTQEQSFLELLSLQMEVSPGMSPALAILKERVSPFMSSHITEMEYFLGGDSTEGEDNDIVLEALNTGLIDEEKISLIINLSQGGTDISGALKTAVLQGRKILSIKLGIFGKLVLGVAVMTIAAMLIIIMSAIVPLGFALMDQYNV